MRAKYYRKDQRQGFFNEMSSRSNGCCMICGNKVRHLVIDHDHETGFMRGVLCMSCNSGLGQFKDDTNLLRLAITYLESVGSLQNVSVSKVITEEETKKRFIYEAMIDLINDSKFTSDRARARELAIRFEITSECAQTRIHRARKILKLGDTRE